MINHSPTHFNQLTAAEDERLALLSEECAEVIEAATDVLNAGLFAVGTSQVRTNKESFERELGQLRYAMTLLWDNPTDCYTDIKLKLVQQECEHTNLPFANDASLTLSTPLIALVNACSKTIIAVTKIQRHGFESCGPYATTNRQRLTAAVGSLLAHIVFVQSLEDFNEDAIGQAMAEKGMNIAAYLHHNLMSDTEGLFERLETASQ